MLPSSATKRLTRPDTHQLQKTYTDTHVTEYNGLAKTVLLPRFSAQDSALAHI